jgi:uncharacterized protein (UPF0128 family)
VAHGISHQIVNSFMFCIVGKLSITRQRLMSRPEERVKFGRRSADYYVTAIEAKDPDGTHYYYRIFFQVTRININTASCESNSTLNCIRRMGGTIQIALFHIHTLVFLMSALHEIIHLSRMYSYTCVPTLDAIDTVLLMSRAINSLDIKSSFYF